MNVLRLKEFRTKAKLKQIDVADALGITQSGYSLLELGKRVADANQIIIMCELFKCSPNDLYGFKGAMSVAIDPLFEDYKELVEKIKK